ncbi:MAG: cation transporter [Crocinitomicaceae bacterium]|nr:cation transporter [Crocinitomicaceae bacterium]
MKNIVVIFAMLFIGNSFAQELKKVEEVTIHTSAECNDCKKRLEDKLNYTKGIRFAELDVPSMNLTVSYTTKKIDLTKIKTIISELGYDADDVKANEAAQKALPACCQPNGHK